MNLLLFWILLMCGAAMINALFSGLVGATGSPIPMVIGAIVGCVLFIYSLYILAQHDTVRAVECSKLTLPTRKF